MTDEIPAVCETLLQPRSVLAMYRRHIEIEERDLFPLAENALTPEARRKVGREMAQRRGLRP